MKDYQTIKEIADRTGVSDKTVRRILRDAGIPHAWSGGRTGQGKIIVRWSDWEDGMQRRMVQIKADSDVMDILEEMASAGHRTH